MSLHLLHTVSFLVTACKYCKVLTLFSGPQAPWPSTSSKQARPQCHWTGQRSCSKRCHARFMGARDTLQIVFGRVCWPSFFYFWYSNILFQCMVCWKLSIMQTCYTMLFFFPIIIQLSDRGQKQETPCRTPAGFVHVQTHNIGPIIADAHVMDTPMFPCPMYTSIS